MSQKTIEAYSQFKRSLDFEKYGERVAQRLAKGAQDYGDKSFSKDPAELVKELQAECLDLAGWGFILHSRLEAMRKALESAEQDRLAKERMSAAIEHVKQAGPPQPPPAKQWGVFCTNRYTGEVYRSIFFDGVYSSEAAARKAFAGCEDGGNRFAKMLGGETAPEQWGVFTRMSCADGWDRSVSDPTTYTSRGAAEEAVIALRVRDPAAICRWIARRLPVDKPLPAPKPAPEQWGVFFRSDRQGVGVCRSNWEPGTFTSEKDANAAVNRLVLRRRHLEPTEWFAQRITAVHR